MSATTEILTTSEVKSLAIVSAKFDKAYIDQYILLSQRRYLRSYLGVDFYNEILDQLDNTSTLTADNLELINNYLKPCLAHYVVYESLPQVRNQISKGGVYNNLSDTGDVASGLDYGRLRDDYLSKAEALKDEISNFIIEKRKTDTNKYPLFLNNKSQNGGVIFY